MTDEEFLHEFKATLALHQDGDLKGAEAGYKALIQARPAVPSLWSNLALIYRKRGHAKAAVAMNLRAMELHANSNDDDGYARTTRNLFNVMRDAFRGDEGLTMDVMDPSNRLQVAGMTDFWRARALLDQSRVRESILFFKTAAQSVDNIHDMNLDLAMALLKIGEYREGFEVFESRWHTGHMDQPPTSGTRWNGEAIDGKRVALIGEQGLGDMIFMSRFLPQFVAQRPAHLTVSIQKALCRLFAGCPGVDSVTDKKKVPNPDMDTWLVGFDLARHLLAENGTFPPPVPFQVPQEASERAAEFVAPYLDRFKVGIVWRTSRNNKIADQKTVDFRHFFRLCEIPKVQLFSLQKDPSDNDIVANGADLLVIDAGSSDADLADTAALIQKLNLVITVDTAVAHLAGTMGTPVWLLTPEPAYWYWYGVGEHTPFYPSMRVVRQSRPGVWDDVFDRIVNDLKRVLQ